MERIYTTLKISSYFSLFKTSDCLELCVLRQCPTTVKFSNEELPPNIIRVTDSRNMGWAKYATRIEEMRKCSAVTLILKVT